MNKSSVTISKPDPMFAIDYLVDHFADSRIVQYLGRGALTSECESISMVTALPPRPGADWKTHGGGNAGSPRDWLIQEALSYMQRTPDGIVVFEDLNSSPSDPYLNTYKHPPFWHHEGRLFGPVLPVEVNRHTVEEAQNWGAAMREVACFSQVPRDLKSVFETRSLSDDELEFIVSSIKYILADVFFGEGYIEWRRRVLAS